MHFPDNRSNRYNRVKILLTDSHRARGGLGGREERTMSLVQYVVVRGDLLTTLKWPVGAVIAQACHACTAVVHMFHSDPSVQEYLKDLDNMHKVVLEAPDEDSLRKLESSLKEAQVDHKLWVEQPEDIPTCLVAKPYPKESVQKYFKKFKLYKGM